MIILNKNIHEFDKLEREAKQKLHSFVEWVRRTIYLIDADLFETRYKDEWEKTNIENDKLYQKVGVLERKNKRLLRKIARLEKEKEKMKKEYERL